MTHGMVLSYMSRILNSARRAANGYWAFVQVGNLKKNPLWLNEAGRLRVECTAHGPRHAAESDEQGGLPWRLRRQYTFYTFILKPCNDVSLALNEYGSLD